MIVTAADVTWTKDFNSQTPGSHVVLIAQEMVDAIRGRVAGYELRDTMAILSSGPRVRFAFLFRKPVEGTAVSTILKYGTGALNIDACRVAGTPEATRFDPAKHKHEGWRFNNSGAETFERSKKVSGRWPSNLVIVHGAECKAVGTRRVKATPPMDRNKPAGFHPTNRVFGTGEGEFHSTGYGDADGFEEAPDWQCELGCSARLLDEQSGVLKSGQLAPNHDGGGLARTGKGGFRQGTTGVQKEYGGDSGGASRFFPQFADEDEMLLWIRRLVA